MSKITNKINLKLSTKFITGYFLIKSVFTAFRRFLVFYLRLRPMRSAAVWVLMFLLLAQQNVFIIAAVRESAERDNEQSSRLTKLPNRPKKESEQTEADYAKLPLVKAAETQRGKNVYVLGQKSEIKLKKSNLQDAKLNLAETQPANSNLEVESAKTENSNNSENTESLEVERTPSPEKSNSNSFVSVGNNFVNWIFALFSSAKPVSENGETSSATLPASMLPTGSNLNTITAAAVSRHRPALNGGKIDGSLRVLSGEAFNFNGPFRLTGDLYTVGTPNIIVNSGASHGGTVNDGGSAAPVGYNLILNSGAVLPGKIHIRADAIQLPADIPASVPAATGTRTVNVNSASDIGSIGNWSTVRDLNFNPSNQVIAVPPGNYGTFNMNGNSRLTFSAGTYNFAGTINLNNGASVQSTGSVVINIGQNLNVNNGSFPLGNFTSPGDVRLNILGSSVTFDNASQISALVRAPNANVNFNNGILRGQIIANYLNVNNGQIIGAAYPAQDGNSIVVFGPKQFDRTTGAPNQYTEQFSLPSAACAPFTLQLQNGSASGSNRISSATVNLNNSDIFTPSDFNQNVGSLERAVNLAATNTLDVRVASNPGSYFTIVIKGVGCSTDTTPPNIAITAPADNSVIVSNQTTVSGTASDTGVNASGIAHIYVNNTEAAYNAGAGTWSLNNVPLSVGANIITARAVDNAGLQSSVQISVTRQTSSSPTPTPTPSPSPTPTPTPSPTPSPTPTQTPTPTPTPTPDTTPPQLVITNPVNGLNTMADRVTVGGTVSDPGAGASGVAVVTVNGVAAVRNVTQGTWTLIDLPLSLGANVITARAVDNAGNASTQIITVTRTQAPPTADTQAPTVAVTSHQSGQVVYDQTVTLSGTAMDTGDNATGVRRVSVNGRDAVYNAGNNTWSLADLALQAGENIVTVEAFDGATPAPNRGLTELRLIRNVIGSPSISIGNPLNGTVVSSNVITVSGTVDAGATNLGVAVTVNGQAAQITNNQFTKTINLIAGSNTITAVAVNARNATAQTSVTVISDQQAPTVALVNPPTLLQRYQSYVIRAEAADNIGLEAIEFTVNGETAAVTATAPYEFTLQIPGTAEPNSLVTISATARDLSGQVATAVAQARVAGQSGVTGYVFDDATGYVLPGVSAALAPNETTVTDENGEYTLVAQTAAGIVRLSKNEFTPVERAFTTASGSGISLFDARLTRADAKTNLIGQAGGTAESSNGAARVVFGPSSFGSQTDVRITTVSPQGLINLLPYGWSPIPGAVIDVRPFDQNLSISNQFPAPARLQITATQNLPSGTATILARYDETSRKWKTVGQTQAGDNGLLAADIPKLGQYAFLIADSGVTAPPPAVAGQELTASRPALSEALNSATVTGTASPASAVISPQAKSTISIVANVPTKLPSGVSVDVTFDESYQLLAQADPVLVERPNQDFVLYAFPAASLEQPNKLGAYFTAKPTRTDLTVAQLRIGRVRAVIRAGREQTGGVLIGAEGGQITTNEGTILNFPAGSLAATTPIFLDALPPEELGLQLPAGYEVIGAAEVNLSGATLSTSAVLSIPQTQNTTARVLIGKLVTVGGVRGLKLVANAIAANNRWISAVSGGSVPANISLSGIVNGGKYVFLKMPGEFGYATGTVRRNGSAAEPNIRVVNANTPFLDLTQSTGRYLVPATIAQAGQNNSNDLNAASMINDATGAATVVVSQPNQVVALDISLATTALSIVSIVPSSNANQVIVTSPVTVTFSKPVNPASVTGSTLRLATQAGNPVIGTIAMLAGNRVAVFTPSAILANDTTYRAVVTTGVRDLYGNQLGAQFDSSFSTTATVIVDNRLKPGQIRIGYPDGATSISTITIPAGAVPVGSIITAINNNSGATVTTTAGTGAVTIQIAARVGDEILLIIRQPDGTEYRVSQAAYRKPDGTVSVSANGGTVTSEDGTLQIDVPPGAIIGQADLKLEPAPESTIMIPRTGEMDPSTVPFGAGMKVTVSGEFRSEKELHLELPAPTNVPENQRIAFMKPAHITENGTERDVWEVITSGKVENGKFKSTSPPFFGFELFSPGLGVQIPILVYAFVPQRFRAITGKITEQRAGAASSPIAGANVTIKRVNGNNVPSVVAVSQPNGNFCTMDYFASTYDNIEIEAKDSAGRSKTGVATPFQNIDPYLYPGLNGIVSMYAALEFPDGRGNPENNPANLRLEGRTLNLPGGQPDTLQTQGRVLRGSQIEIKTTAVPMVQQITGKVKVNGVLKQTLVFSGGNGAGTYLTDFAADQEGSYSVEIVTLTQTNLPTTRATANFNFLALTNPNTRGAQPGPPSVISISPRNGATQVDAGRSIHIEFSEPVRNLIAGQTVYLVDTATNQHLGGTITSGGLPVNANSPNISSIDFQAVPGMEGGKTYRVEVTTGVKDYDENNSLTELATSTFETFRSIVLTPNPIASGAYRIASAGDYAATIERTGEYPALNSALKLYDMSDPTNPTLVENFFVPQIATGIAMHHYENGEEPLKINQSREFRTIIVVTTISHPNFEVPNNLFLYGINNLGIISFIGAVSLNAPAADSIFPSYPTISGKRAYIGYTSRGGVWSVDLENAARQLAEDTSGGYRAVTPAGFGQENLKQKVPYVSNNTAFAPVWGVSVIDQPVNGSQQTSPVAYIASNTVKAISMNLNQSGDGKLGFYDGNGDGVDDRIIAQQPLDPPGGQVDVKAVGGLLFNGQSKDLALNLDPKRLYILDVTTATAPVQLSNRKFVEMGLDAADTALRMETEGKLAYIMFSNKIAVIDFSDPLNPYLSATITGIGEGLRWLTVKDGYVYSLDSSGRGLQVSIGRAAAQVLVHGFEPNSTQTCANPVVLKRATNQMAQAAEIVFRVYGHDAARNAKVIIRKITESDGNTQEEVIETITPIPGLTSSGNTVSGKTVWGSSASIEQNARYTAQVVVDAGLDSEFIARQQDIPFSYLIDNYSPKFAINKEENSDHSLNGGVGYFLGGTADVSLKINNQPVGLVSDKNGEQYQYANSVLRPFGKFGEGRFRGINDLPDGEYLFQLQATLKSDSSVTDEVEGTVIKGGRGDNIRRPGSIVVSGVEIETGNLAVTHQDIAEIKYHDLSLSLQRSYNTQNASNYSPFGYGWGHNYQVVLIFDPSANLYTVLGGEGNGQHFKSAEVQNGEAKSLAPYQAKLVRTGGDSFDFYTKGRIKYHFNAALSTTAEDYNQLSYMGNLSYIEDTHGNRISLRYDNERRLASVSDGAGRALQFAYELSDVPLSGFSADDVNATTCSPASVKLARQRFLQASLAKAWRILKVTAPGGLTVDYIYDDKGNLTEARRSGGDDISDPTVDAAWKFAYNPSANNDPKYSHLLKTIESPNSTTGQPHKTVYEYDLTTVGYPVKKITMPESVVNTFAYSVSGAGNKRTVVTDGNGRTTDYQSDALCNTENNPSPNYQCRTTTIAAPLGATTEIRWNAYGAKLYERDPEGTSTTTSYDNDSNPVNTTVAGGNESITTTQTFDPKFNRLSSMRDGRGNTTSYTIDPANGDVQAVALPTGKRILLSYDAIGNLIERTDEANYKTKFQNYDTAGNPRAVERQSGTDKFETTTLAYDARGRLLTSADTLGASQTNTYDTFDRPTSQITEDPTGIHDRLTVTSKYLPEGQLKEQTRTGTGQNYKIVNLYDALNRLTKATETASNATGNVRQFSYDLNSNLITAQDRRGAVTTRAYNELNFVIKETVSGAFGDPLVTMDVTQIDNVGNARKVKDLTGTETELIYDGLHRLQTRQQKGDRLGSETVYQEESKYDQNNNLISQKDRNARETRVDYDSVNRPIKKTDALGRITNWVYDDANKTVTTTMSPQGLTQIVKQDGIGRPTLEEVKFSGKDYNTTHSYDGRKVTTTDARGTVSVSQLSAMGETGQMSVQNSDPAYSVEMRYAGFGGVKSQKDALARTTTIAQDGFGRNTNVVYPGGFSESTVYDQAGLVTAHTDRRGVSVSMSYDNLGRLLTKTVPDNGTTINVETIAYLDAERKESRSDANGHTSEMVYDGLHRLVGLTNADGKTRTLKYDGQNLREESDYKGKLTKYEYDAVDRPVKVLDRLGDGQATIIEHNDSNGYTKTVTDRRANKRIEKFDQLGRILNITDGGLPLAAFEYDAGSNQTAETDGEGHRSEFVYDVLNRLKTKKNAVGSQTAYQEEVYSYDAVGNLTDYFDGRGGHIVQAFDPLNQLRSRKDGEQNETIYSYDGEGLLTFQQEPKGVAAGSGYQTSYSYNALRSLKSVTDAKSKTWSFVYDAAQNLKSVTDPRTFTTNYDYDNLDRLTKVTQPLGKITVNEYDDNSNKIKITDPNGQITQIVPDDLDRTGSVKHYKSGGAVERTVDYSLDGEGNAYQINEQIVDGATQNRTYARQFDARNRLKQTTDYRNQTVKFDYDRANNVTLITDAANKRTGYLYDEQNRVKTVTTNDGESIVYNWYTDGLLKNVNYKNGLKREYSYDNADRVSSIKNTVGVNTAGTQTQEFSYGYDPNSNRLSETRKTDGATSKTLAYNYDELNRLALSTDTTPAPNTQPSPGQSIQVTENSLLTGNGYDAVGNRETITTQPKTRTITRTANGQGQVSETSTEQAGQISTATAQFDALNRLTNLSENNVNTAFAYDNNGNLLSETVGGTVQKRYEYDTRDQLKKVFAGTSNQIAQFDYDFQRHRTSKQTANTNLHYVYAGDDVVDEFDSSSGLLPLQNRYELGAGEVVKGELRNEPTNYYFSDALGSTTNLSQLNGTQSFSTSTAEYDSFGKINNQTGASANAIGYTGQRLDTETGLMALGNGERYYSPALARFTQQDSLTGKAKMPQSLNRYSYAINNPNKYVDPSGNEPVTLTIAGILAISYLASVAINAYQQDQQIKRGERRQQDFSLSEAAVSGNIIGNTYAATTGEDVVSGRKLTGFERSVAGVEAGLEFASVAGKAIGATSKVARIARTANLIGNVAEVTQAGIGVYRGGSATAQLIYEGNYSGATLTAGLTFLSALGGYQSARSLRGDISGVREAFATTPRSESSISSFAEAIQENSVNTLKFADDPLLDNNILVEANKGTKTATDFLDANRGLLSYGKTSKYEFLAGTSRKDLSSLTKNYDLTYFDNLNYKDVIKEAKFLRSKFEATDLVLNIKDSRQLASAKLLGIDFVTNDIKLYKRAADLDASGYMNGVKTHYLDLFPLAPGVKSKNAGKAASYMPKIL